MEESLKGTTFPYHPFSDTGKFPGIASRWRLRQSSPTGGGCVNFPTVLHYG
jgi:hypothetical protein